MATLSNRTFYKSGVAGASAVVGFESQVNRVVRYNLDLEPGENASHIDVVFVGEAYDICIEFVHGEPGVSELNKNMPFYFAISTDPDAFANAGYTDIASATGKAVCTKVPEYGAEKYEISCSADIMLYSGTQYYLWIFPGFSNAAGGNGVWGWLEWNNTPIEVSLTEVALTYTISYDANEGEGAPAEQTKTHGVSIQLSLEQPIRDRYLFQGWADTKDGVVLYQPGSSYTTDASVTLYAVWIRYEYTDTFDPNGGSGGGELTGEPGSAYSTPSASLTGHTFTGWWSNAIGGLKYADADQLAIHDDIDDTFYAQWVKNSYTISYDANGGSGAPNAQTKTYGTSIELALAQPTRDGYLFQGWSTDPGGMVLYQPGASYVTEESVTLYAIWKVANLVIKNCRACVKHSGSTYVCGILIRHQGTDTKCRTVIKYNDV